MKHEVYFPHIVSAVTGVDGKLHSVRPNQKRTRFETPDGFIVWMVGVLVCLNVKDKYDAVSAQRWADRIVTAMVMNGHWTEEYARALYDLDAKDVFKQVVE